MGLGVLGCCVLVLTVFIQPLPVFSQQPNTDEYYVSDFFTKMGISSSTSSSGGGGGGVQTPICSWRGVFCDDREENVIKLIVPGLGLSGPIPDTTVGKLSKLQDFDLSNNVGNFGLLESIDLSSNNLSGEIPAAIGSLKTLRMLRLSDNGFQGTIPPGLLNCRSLVSLDLSANLLIRSLPDGFGAFISEGVSNFGDVEMDIALLF